MTKMSSLCQPLIGASLQSVEKKDYSWFFRFTGDTTVGTESEWRFIAEGHILVTSSDHGHQFGLPSPVDAIARVISHIASQLVRAASISEITGDLHIEFDGDSQLQFLQMSSGYESWRLGAPGVSVICGGGGRLA